MEKLEGFLLELNPDEISSTHHDLTDFSEDHFMGMLQSLEVNTKPGLHLFYRHDRAKGDYEHLMISRGSYERFEIIYNRWEANKKKEKKVLTSSDVLKKGRVPALYCRRNNGEVYRVKWQSTASLEVTFEVVRYFFKSGTIDRSLAWVDTY